MEILCEYGGNAMTILWEQHGNTMATPQEYSWEYYGNTNPNMPRYLQICTDKARCSKYGHRNLDMYRYVQTWPDVPKYGHIWPDIVRYVQMQTLGILVLWEYSGNALRILWEHPGNTLRILWEHSVDTLGILWEYFGNPLRILWELSETLSQYSAKDSQVKTIIVSHDL